jgi:acyl-CoA thioesterase YciA
MALIERNQPAKESLTIPSEPPSLRVVARLLSANAHGDVPGGWLLSQADLAGSIVAARRAGGRVVTVALDSIRIKHRILVGDVVSFYATVVQESAASITVQMHVYAERLHKNAEVIKVTEASITYMAVDMEEKRYHLKDQPGKLS